MSRSSRSRRLALTVLLLSAGSGCEAIFGPSDCTTELTVAYGPEQATIRVGETFTARATGLTCSGKEQVDTDMSWSTSDPTVVVIGQKSGLAVGIGPGEATITGTDHGRAAIGPITIPVQVVE